MAEQEYPGDAAVTPLVIVGTGLAGYTVAREWRKLVPDQALTIISVDDGSFYSKPMLSNALTARKSPQQLATFSAAQMAEQLQATILTQARVTALHPERAELTLLRDDGVECRLGYGQLVLALGADAVSLPLAGDGAGGVYAVNDLQDYRRLRAALEQARSVLVLGAGFVGCEFANDLRLAGYEVSVADPAPYALSRFVPESLGRQLVAALQDIGIGWYAGWAAREVLRQEGKLLVTLEHAAGARQQLPVDLVLSATGLRPRVALAQAAGLHVNRGIVTDAWLRTSDARVYALGDCAEVAGVVQPFVMPLMHCARALAKNLAGTPAPVAYPTMPIVLKTPSYPVIVVPPDPGLAGSWQVTEMEGGVKALSMDADGKLLGFALGGSALTEKAALLKALASA